jgi:hypothetical protein
MTKYLEPSSPMVLTHGKLDHFTGCREQHSLFSLVVAIDLHRMLKNTVDDKVLPNDVGK